MADNLNNSNYEWDNLSLSSNSSNNVSLTVRTCNIYKCKLCYPEAKKMRKSDQIN